MMFVTQSETEGTWWLPETSDHRVPGTLVRETGGRLTLVTHAALRQYEYPSSVNDVVEHHSEALSGADYHSCMAIFGTTWR